MYPSGDTAKNKRSVKSQASEEIGRGNWNVVSRDVESRSQTYEECQIEAMIEHVSCIPLQSDQRKPSMHGILGKVQHRLQHRSQGAYGPQACNKA
jgi:hypothetical protein